MITAVKSIDKMRIIEEYPEGRGGVIEIPLAKATHGIIAARTAGGGPGTYDLALQQFHEIVRNFPKRNGVPKVYFTHDRDLRDSYQGEIPVGSAGVIQGVGVEGDQLWGRIPLGPQAWKVVVADDAFHGFSVEFDEDGKTTNGVELPGAYLTGGIFTNNPALDVAFARAASSESAPGRRFSTPLFWGSTEDEMAEKTLEALQAEKTALEKKLAEADTAAKAKDAKLAETERQLEELKAKEKATADEKALAEKAAAEKAAEGRSAAEKIKALESTNVELKNENKALGTKLGEVEKRQLSSEVVMAGKDAINGDGKEGVPPAAIEGFDTDPMKYLAENCGSADQRGLDVFKRQLAKATKVKFGTKGVGTGESEGGDGTQPVASKLLAEVDRVMTERKCGFEEARAIVRETKPALYAEYTNAPLRGETSRSA